MALTFSNRKSVASHTSEPPSLGMLPAVKGRLSLPRPVTPVSPALSASWKLAALERGSAHSMS
jgi:hypothetical protein